MDRLAHSEQAAIASALAEAAAAGGVVPATTLRKLDISPATLNLQGAPHEVWALVLSRVHAGASATAGSGRDAVARLVSMIADELPGNRELAALMHEHSPDVDPRDGDEGIFLSYSSTNRSDVDRLFDELADKTTIPTFQDHRAIELGSRWLDVLRREASRASVLVAWTSDAFLESPYTAYEVGLAESRGARVVPIVVGVEPEALPAFLSERHSIVATDPIDFAYLAERIATTAAGSGDEPEQGRG